MAVASCSLFPSQAEGGSSSLDSAWRGHQGPFAGGAGGVRPLRRSCRWSQKWGGTSSPFLGARGALVGVTPSFSPQAGLSQGQCSNLGQWARSV